MASAMSLGLFNLSMKDDARVAPSSLDLLTTFIVKRDPVESRENLRVLLRSTIFQVKGRAVTAFLLDWMTLLM